MREGGREAEGGEVVAHGPAAGFLLLGRRFLFVGLEVGGGEESARGGYVLRGREGGREGGKEGGRGLSRDRQKE